MTTITDLPVEILVQIAESIPTHTSVISAHLRLTCKYAQLMPVVPHKFSVKHNLIVYLDYVQVYQLNIPKNMCKLAIPVYHETCHTDIIQLCKWLVNHGCVNNADTCREAASIGNIRLIEWLRETGCEWDSWTCAYAAQNGHLAMLEMGSERPVANGFHD